MSPFILALIFAVVTLLLAILFSNLIQYEGGNNPKDPGKRKMVFWVFAALTPIIFYLLGYFVLSPDPNVDQMAYNSYMGDLPIACAVSVGFYILVGFILAKILKHGKIGHWF